MDAENMLDYMRKQHISENENSDSQPTQTSTSVENFSRKMGKTSANFWARYITMNYAQSLRKRPCLPIFTNQMK